MPKSPKQYDIQQMYKQNTYKLQKTMKTNSTSKHNNKTCTLKEEKQRKKQLSEK